MKRLTIDVPVEAGRGPLAPSAAEDIERVARSAGARSKDVRAIPVAALIAARPPPGEQGRERVY
jgi:hypothetical protein